MKVALNSLTTECPDVIHLKVFFVCLDGEKTKISISEMSAPQGVPMLRRTAPSCGSSHVTSQVTFARFSGYVLFLTPNNLVLLLRKQLAVFTGCGRPAS